jgi:FtsH-binding integral membrane protein
MLGPDRGSTKGHTLPPMERPIRIAVDKAQALLKQCKWLLIACIAAFVLFAVRAYADKMDSVAMTLFAIFWVASGAYYIWLGRLAYGLGRSVVYYVGLTWVASGAVFLIAHLIAYSNIRAATKRHRLLYNARDVVTTRAHEHRR